MATERKKPGKSESLTIRLDPKTRFQLEFVSRIRGQTITTVIERSILEAADNARIRGGDFEQDLTWQSVWDVNEGIRALKIARHSELYPSYEEERRLNFTELHWPFFYTDNKKDVFFTTYIEVLWPRIDEFINIFEKTKLDDYFQAGKEMQACLKAAKIKPPEWPPTEKSSRSNGSRYNDLDDDIPF